MAATIVDIKDPADIVTPAAGTVELFMDSTNNNHLSYMNSSRVVTDLQETVADSDEECCACDLEKQFWSTVSCALNSGMMSADQFQTIVNTGFNVSSQEVTDNLGNKSCSVQAGGAVVSVSSVEITSGAPDILVGATHQITTTVLPANATNKNLIYISSDVTKATVNSTGLVTGIAVGTATVYVYSAENLSIVDSVLITVSV